MTLQGEPGAAGPHNPNPNPSAVPVTEEGRSWTLHVCPDCGCTRLYSEGNGTHLKPICPHPKGSSQWDDFPMTPVEVVESSKLLAVEAELGRLKEALRTVEADLGPVGPDEVLDQDVPAETGRRWVLSHENGLRVGHAFDAAHEALDREQYGGR